MPWRLAAAALAALAFVAGPSPAFGACATVPGNLVGNCSFEEPVTSGDLPVGPGQPLGAWTVSTGSDTVDLVNAGFAGRYPVFDGTQSVDLNRDHPGAVEQVLATTPGVTYRVTVQLSGFPAPKANCTATEPEQLRVSAGSVSRDFSFQPDDAATPPGNQRFEQHTVDFVGAGGDRLKLAGLNEGCTGPVVDDVVVARTDGAAPRPALGKSVTAATVSGTVLVKLPRAKSFAPLTVTAPLPVGTIVDARKGRVRITATAGGKTFFGDFYEGIFQIAQQRKKGATADLKLFGGNFTGCPKAPKASAAKGKKRSVRHLWGESDGKFRSVGRFSSAAVRGTTWLTDDQCTGTLTKVTAGAVTVRDFARRRSVVVRAGKTYFAAARGG